MKSANLLGFLGEIKNFDELEDKLIDLSDKEKGDLFELFCQVYLKTIYKKQVFKSVQLFRDVSPTTLERLNLRIGKDYGIDIVAITDADDIWTVQVKFRQSDQLTWTELSTFRASSEKAVFTLLMSNVSKVNHPHKSLTDFSSILRTEFEALTQEDFANIKAELKGQVVKPKVFTPRAHQIEAIRAAVNYFKTNNLGQMIHACGTGKTLTSLWIKEALKPKNTIVYVPSLSLLKQTLEEWTKHKSSNFSIKCVCSDQSVSRGAQELDEVIVDFTELGVPVTTDAKEIAKFLKSDGKDKIVFSTYQSAPVILDAMELLPGFSFDFGVFDEAHRTASKSEHLFAKSLKTLAGKKLFMTATPKLYAPHVKSRAKEEDALLCSMDDSSIYGEVFHEIKFGEAIKLNLLSDYKIKVIVVSNSDVRELIDRRYWLDVLGKEITADELAKVWALLKSLDDTNHVISFHSRIHGAKEFQILVAKTIELLRSHEKEVRDVKTYHIAGEMPTYQRSKILSEFIAQKKSLVTNARCLTEGVDVPAIDGVYFVDPKQNLIDIVQAVGRAIRKKPTKYGYIIIPVFVGDEKNVERIIESSAFAQVWSVVEAMKDQDARLAHVIEKLQELKGKKRFGSLKAREQAEERKLKADLGNIFDDSVLPKNIDVPDFIEYIGLKTLEVVGQSWDEKFGEYVAFREEMRRDPLRESKNIFENKLSYWVGTQRSWHNQNRLTKERFDKLTSIGFNWGSTLNKWDQVFEHYRSFRIKNNQEPLEGSEDGSEVYLARWASTQRTLFNKNKLFQNKIDKLKLINFVWNIFETNWNSAFEKYRLFKVKNNREPSESSKNESERFVGKWASHQRTNYNKDKLSSEKIDMLNSVGFNWNITDSQWNQMFEKYKDFKDRNSREPSAGKKSEKFLASWAIAQRRYRNRNNLPRDRVNRLNSLGFDWNVKGNWWEKSFHDYKSFKQKYNREPSGKSKDKVEKESGVWARHQRIEYNKNNLSQERISKLNSVGIVWDQKKNWWEDSFNDYVRFRNQLHREPLHTSENKLERDIAVWITRQRIHYKKNKLSQDRITKLNSINFIWDQKEIGWNQAFEDYQTFKKKHGREPSNSSKDEFERFLAHWAGFQRTGYGRKKRATPQNRTDRLNSINFIWDIKDEQWERLLRDYISFKGKYNREPSNKSKSKLEMTLGSWANRQRVEYNKKRLSPERIETLKLSGFEFDRIGDPWTLAFDKYSSFRKEFDREPLQTSKIKSEKFLGGWASKQRTSFKKNNLSKYHTKKLNAIEFRWFLQKER